MDKQKFIEFLEERVEKYKEVHDYSLKQNWLFQMSESNGHLCAYAFILEVIKCGEFDESGE